jgi:hypothetical protein
VPRLDKEFVVGTPEALNRRVRAASQIPLGYLLMGCRVARRLLGRNPRRQSAPQALPGPPQQAEPVVGVTPDPTPEVKIEAAID